MHHWWKLLQSGPHCNRYMIHFDLDLLNFETIATMQVVWHIQAVAAALTISSPPSLNVFSATQDPILRETLGVERSSLPPLTPFHPTVTPLTALLGPRKLKKCNRQDLSPPSSTPHSTAAAVPLYPGRLPHLGTLRTKAAARSLTRTQLLHTVYLATRSAGESWPRELSGTRTAT